VTGFGAAKEAQVLKISTSPERMDLKDEHAKKARAAGVKLSMNSDAHSVAGLGNLEWGLCMARRAGLESADVINTYSLAALMNERG
jgi:DNA polymerase (family X)